MQFLNESVHHKDRNLGFKSGLVVLKSVSLNKRAFKDHDIASPMLQ